MTADGEAAWDIAMMCAGGLGGLDMESALALADEFGVDRGVTALLVPQVAAGLAEGAQDKAERDS